MAINKIGGYPRDNGKYLEKFDTRDEAIDYIKMLGRKYQYAPNQNEMSLRKLKRYAKNEGVVVYINQLSNWFKQLGIKVKGKGNASREKERLGRRSPLTKMY